ncbi:MAG: class I SAM-dependent RNA methyltransferase [Bacteroidales bacterium]|nr:class I SAM-dependent RNA methyltransferase [Bacteroidales bacterium]MCF8405579.1 class I SAM-dependent RNA methyltransferase [Bacteroidales bacterium]
MSEQQIDYRIIAKTFAGLEKVLAEEIRVLGGQHIKVMQRAVEFTGDKSLLYKANYLCRAALRIIKPVASFFAENEDKLYKEVKNIQWEDYLDIHSTFSVDGLTSFSNITHSKYLALKSKDAIVDRFREATGKRPSVDKDNADLRINVRIFKNNCTVSLDSSGESLHKRGYRQGTGPAPLNEVLAAGMILLSGWKGKSNFIDPMCGSGTLPIEAAMIALNIPAGKFIEKFAFESWKDFDPEIWQQIKNEAFDNIRENKIKIIGSDWSGRILQVARDNIKAAGLEENIELHPEFVKDVIPPPSPGVMVTNPPYGERIKMSDISNLYREIGDALKQNFKGYSAWIISSHMDAIKHIGLKPSDKYKLFNGPLECSYVGFDMYEGSRKEERPYRTKENQTSSPAQKKEFRSQRNTQARYSDRNQKSHGSNTRGPKRRPGNSRPTKK